MIDRQAIQMRAGATPQVFDGNQSITLKDSAKKLVGIEVSHSLSTGTVEEGFAMMLRLQSPNWAGSHYFIMGGTNQASTNTNTAASGLMVDLLALDIDVQPNTTITVDITTVAGAVQSGTHDVTIVLLIDDGNTPQDVLDALRGGNHIVPAKGGSFGYTTALTTADRTALTGNLTTLNVPPVAEAIIGAVALMILDTAVTANEELGGKIEVETGIEGQGTQEIPLNGGNPEIGNAATGSNMTLVKRLPMYIETPNREIQIKAFVTPYSAITGGADHALNLLWR